MEVSFTMAYEVEAYRKHPGTGEFRCICKYRFDSTATSVKSLKDIVRRDLWSMGFRAHCIVIRSLDANISYTINCRQS